MKGKILFTAISVMVFIFIIANMPHTLDAADNVKWDDVTGAKISSSYYSSEVRESWHHGDCKPTRAVVERYGVKDERDICVTHSAGVSLASYTITGFRHYALKKPSDVNYHQLSNVHEPALPVLMSDDTLLTVNLTQSNPLQFISLSSVHQKVIESTTQNNVTEFSKIYTIDTSQADIVRDGSGRTVQADSIAVSQNNKYAAIAVLGRGVALVNLETKTVKLIAYEQISSLEQGINLAVSNDGSRVVVAGKGIEKDSVYLVDENCGDPEVYTHHEMSRPCVNIEFNDEIRNAQLAHLDLFYVKFSSTTDEASLYFWDHTDSTRHIAHVNPDPEQMRLQYLALGDSYSSGEGDTEKVDGKKFYRSYTDIDEDTQGNIPREKCHISTRSYPYLLAQGMALGAPLNTPKTKWQTIACSGAQVYDVVNSHANYRGQGKGGSEGGKPRLDGYNVEHLQEMALNDFIPGREKQIEFVKKYRPKVITLTMGGNDIGFADKISACATPLTLSPTCESAEGEGRSRLGATIRHQYDKLRSFYLQLYAASGYQAKIYVIGYPQFINGSPNASCKPNVGALNDAEREMITHSVSYLNSVTKQAAISAGVQYIDIEESLSGGKLCEASPRHVTGISGFLGRVDSDERQESFHPTPSGHGRMSDAIKSATGYRSLLTYNVCQSSESTLCPNETATKENIPPSSYFGIDGLAREYQYMTNGSARKGDSYTISTKEGSFAAGASVRGIFFSEPTDVGIFTADTSGKVSAWLTIPSSLSAGYHTLVLSGISPSGDELFEYEQVVLVEGRDIEDIDEDGVRDSAQPCGAFTHASGIDIDEDGLDDSCDPIIGDAPTPTVPSEPSNPGQGSQEGVILQELKKISNAIKSFLKLVILFLGQFF